VLPKYTQGFSTILSFAERFELGSSSKGCLLIRGSFRFLVEIVSNCLFRASSAFKLFEAGLRSLELYFSGQQCLQVIRGWASAPQIVFFGPAVPSSYSRLGFGLSNCLFRASSAFKLFEAGLRILELSFLAQQCLQSVRAMDLRIIPFKPAAPLYYSGMDVQTLETYP
jgi:hypothetical protein